MSIAIAIAMSAAADVNTSRAPRASVAPWLGVLFVLVLVLITVGGYVRLSGSGLSIPDWPIIRIGTSWSLLPPMSEDGWLQVRASFLHDQAALRDEAHGGAIGLGSPGRMPADMPTFQLMFLTEWSHRFVAALVGVVAAGCAMIVLRRRELRMRIGAVFLGTCMLIVGQAVVGGVLVKSHTATHWLFLHLGIGAAILALVVWSILRLVCDEAPAPDPATYRSRRRLVHFAAIGIAVAWVQVVLGALVAGSRGDPLSPSHDQFVSTWPAMGSDLIPVLWVRAAPLAWNLLDNAWLHQWLHRWFALVVALALFGLYAAAARAPLAPRLRLGLRVSMTFLALQIVLGLSNVLLTHPTVVSLAHLVMGMFLLVSLVMVYHDAGYEAAPAGGGLAATGLRTAS